MSQLLESERLARIAAAKQMRAEALKILRDADEQLFTLSESVTQLEDDESTSVGVSIARLTDAIGCADGAGDTVRMQYDGCDVYIHNDFGERCYGDNYAWHYWIEITVIRHRDGREYIAHCTHDEDDRSLQMQWLNRDEIARIAEQIERMVDDVSTPN